MDQIKLEFILGEKILSKKMEELPEELDKKIKEFKEASFDLLNEQRGEEGNEYPIVTFLGTGSAVPNIYRNVSANLLQTNEKSNFLIDCGEGTYAQMNALFGPEEIEKELTKLNAIFITHHHVDHFLGFFKILQKRKEAFEKLELHYKQLIVVCNSHFINLCDKFSREFADLRPYIFFMNWIKLITQNSDEKLIEQKRGYANLEEKMKGGIFALDEWNIRQIRAIQVIHKKWSCGFSFQTELENRKIVFSGDTQPSENLEWWGKDADLLIHECTLEDGMEIDANKKRHSTMRQAFDSANKMRAKNVILTHFSMRYSQVPPLPEYLIEAGNFSCAKDNMVVPFKLLPLFHKLLPVYQSLYIDELQEISRKKLNRIFDENKKKKEENEMNENERRKMMENNDEQINEENDAKNQPTMSKNQIKKLKRREKLLKNRMEKRKLEREKRKEKKRKNEVIRTKIQLNLMSESKCGIRVAIDMAFDELMDEKTVKKTISQLAYSYSANRRATNPLQFYIVNFDGKAKEIFDSIPSYSHWDANIKTESLKELWNAEEIYYLTADSENILEKLDENRVYVIGGLLDHNHHKGICLEKAKTNGFGHARLPIDSFFRLSGRKVLTINQVFDIIVRFSQDQNWEKAFLEVIPKRKGIELKGIDDEGQNE